MQKFDYTKDQKTKDLTVKRKKESKIVHNQKDLKTIGQMITVRET